MAEHGALAQFTHRLARRALAAGGRVTAGLRMEPGFLIVGAQRCGTTSFHRILNQHPAVLPAGLNKGIHYFDTHYHRGPQWYRAHFPTRAAATRLARRTGQKVSTGEASPYYMFHPLSPQRIAADLPGVKVIVLLRDPVERAHSAHAHELARGFETEPFERALELEESRLDGEVKRIHADPTYVSLAHQHQAYLARGRYVHQLRRLEDALGRDNVHVIDFEDLFADFATGMREVLEFLELSDWLPAQVQQRNARPRSSLPEALRRELAAQYEEDDERLAAWWGRTPSWRR